jgi:CheY-like chemotaxis protein
MPEFSDGDSTLPTGALPFVLRSQLQTAADTILSHWEPPTERLGAAMSVLLVEDHLSTRLAMCDLLHDAGYRVTEAGSVAEGIAAATGHQIALLDLELPDGLGTEVLQHIRQQPHHTRVAFITAAGDMDELVVDADAVFQKPANFDAILRWMSPRS